MKNNPVPFYQADQPLVDQLCRIIRAMYSAAPADFDEGILHIELDNEQDMALYHRIVH